jgi:glucosamine kinase
MKVISDSGSTKSDWVFVSDDGNSINENTIGFNPFYFSSEQITAELRKDFLTRIPGEIVEEVFFYGAGCSDTMRCDIVKEGLTPIFPNAKIYVEHDLLGAARACCGKDPGVACIIGTGSNSCLYDGKDVIDNVTNLGFMLGDEGSGGYLGKTLVQHYFYRELPKDLHILFEEQYPYGKREFLNRIYGTNPNVYLASFARFVSDHKDHPFIQNLVLKAFKEFILRHIAKYNGAKGLPINFVGSVAHYFQELLDQALSLEGFKIGRIVKKPIDNLVRFHQDLPF